MEDNEKKRIAVSGINGFVGHHLARELNECGVGVIGVGIESEIDRDISNAVDEYHQSDLTKEWPNITNVNAVIHLASLANAGESFEKPQQYISANSSMVTNLCEYYTKQGEKPRILIVSSGNVYDPKQPMPISENGELGFNSPYAVSKILVENQAAYYRNRGIDCIVTRTFNHIGPGQAKGFIIPDFYERIALLKDAEKTIITGNIETHRDYTDVRDVVRAYGKIALSRSLQFGTYNICSGNSRSGLEMLNILKEVMGRPDIEYQIDQSLVRPTDIANIQGDSSRIRNELNWEPRIDIRQTITDFVQSKRS